MTGELLVSSALLAAAGSNVSGWAYAGGLFILLGSLVVVLMQLRRMRTSKPESPETPPSAGESADDGPISPDDPR